VETDRSPILAKCIDDTVAPHGFRRIEPIPSTGSIAWIAAWKRKTWNTNRGIALISMPTVSKHPGEYALDIRGATGKAIGYIPFLYELGLQLVMCGAGIVKKGEGLDRYVTKINNSTVLLQSIHLVDVAGGGSLSARTWGQVITGKFIDAIETGIVKFRSTHS
jgi:hypothetical protein